MRTDGIVATTVVDLFDPTAMTRLPDDPGLDEVADEVRNRLACALQAVPPMTI